MADRKTELREEFERQAEWRHEKTAQHPDDDRNREAADLHRRLAETVAQCPTEVIETAWEFFEDGDSEDWHEMMRSIGFHYWPDTAEQFCREFIAKQVG